MTTTLTDVIEALESEQQSIVNRQVEIEETNWLHGRDEHEMLEDRYDAISAELEDLYKQVPPKDLRHPLDDQHCWHCDPADDWNEIPF